MLRIYTALILGFALSIVAGCGTQPQQSLSVTGQVRYHGQPIHGGVVAFAPDADRGNSGPLAIGEISLRGSYQLKTADRQSIAPGWYRVTIVAGNSMKLPEKYRDPQRSGLSHEVRGGQANLIDFDLN